MTFEVMYCFKTEQNFFSFVSYDSRKLGLSWDFTRNSDTPLMIYVFVSSAAAVEEWKQAYKKYKINQANKI